MIACFPDQKVIDLNNAISDCPSFAFASVVDTHSFTARDLGTTRYILMQTKRERTTSDPLLETFYTSSMQLIRSDEVPPMKRDGILWHSGVGGIRDFGSLIKIHVFFANDTFWNIFKHLTVVD